MDDLCTIVAILLVVSLVGHAFWILVRAAVRTFFPDAGKEQNKRFDPFCRDCQVTLEPHQVRCPSCGRMLPGGRHLQADDVRATRRQILRLRDDGLIDADETQQLLRKLQAAVDPHRASGPAREPKRPPASESETEKQTPATSPAAAAVDWADVEDTAQTEPGPTMQQLLRRSQAQSTPAQTTRPRSTPPEKPASPTGTDQPPAPRQPVEPRRGPGEVLATFMEDRNIRWGELVSSVLIVGCSIGLVISLWSTLESIPYFPALLFLLVTVAIHGAGLYTLHRWRLKTTSRGLLTIAQLLIPLNFLAAIALSNRSTPLTITSPLVLGAIALGLTVFGAVAVSGARVLSRPFQWWPLVLAVMLPSFGQVVINRTVTAQTSTDLLFLLGGLPVFGFVAACVGQLAESRDWSRLTRRRTIQLLRVAGIGTFATVIPLGLLCWKSASPRETLDWLSPLISVAAASTLAIGLRIHRDAQAAHLSQFRTAGTALSIFSGLLMASCLAIAWPHTGLLIAIGLTNFVVLVALARISGFAGLLVPAIESLALAALIGAHLVLGTLTTGGEGLAIQTAAGGSYTPSLLTVLFLGRSGLLLQLGTALTLGAAFLLQRKGQGEAAKSTAIAGAGLLIGSVIACGNAALNLGTQTVLDVDLATLGLLIDGVATLAAALFVRHPAVTYLGSGLMLAAISHGLLVNTAVERFLERISMAPDHPLVVSLLAHGFLMSLFALATRHWLKDPRTTTPLSPVPYPPRGEGARRADEGAVQQQSISQSESAPAENEPAPAIAISLLTPRDRDGPPHRNHDSPLDAVPGRRQLPRPRRLRRHRDADLADRQPRIADTTAAHRHAAHRHRDGRSADARPERLPRLVERARLRSASPPRRRRRADRLERSLDDPPHAVPRDEARRTAGARGVSHRRPAAGVCHRFHDVWPRVDRVRAEFL